MDCNNFITLQLTFGQASELREVVGRLSDTSDSEASDAMRDLFAEVTSSIEHASDYDMETVLVEVPFDEVSARAIGLALVEYAYGEA